MTLDLGTVDTPLGPIGLYGDGDELLGLTLDGRIDLDNGVARHLARHLAAFTTRATRDPGGAATRLRRYVRGELAALDEQPVRLLGTDFQRAVWQALRRIPAGSTRSYAQLAAAAKRPNAVRAAGAANGANPIALFVPCHRVIGADGTLWGYGGGLARKAWLLKHEGATFSHGSQEELSLSL